MKLWTPQEKALNKIRGRELRKLRQANGLEGKELAKKTGLHWCTILRAEKGHVAPSPDTIRAIARVLGRGVNKIYNDPCFLPRRKGAYRPTPFKSLLSPGYPILRIPTATKDSVDGLVGAIASVQEAVKIEVKKAVTAERVRISRLLADWLTKISSEINPPSVTVVRQPHGIRCAVPKCPKIRRKKPVFLKDTTVLQAIRARGGKATSGQLARRIKCARDTARRWADKLCQNGDLVSYGNGPKRFFATPRVPVKVAPTGYVRG